MKATISAATIRTALVVSSVCGLFAAGAFAHPASGIVVNAMGDVFFVHTGKGACRIDAQGKLTYIHKDTGGHWMALDTEGKFSNAAGNRLFERITPTGIKPTLLFASGGAPLVVNRDGNLYYGSGFPDGDDMAPGFHTVTRMSPDGKKTLFAPDLKTTLEKLGEGVMGLAAGPDGSLVVSCPNAILKVKMDGTVTTFVHPVVMKDCDDDLAKDSHTRAFHSPYLRGLDVTEEGTVYAAVTGCRCVVKISSEGKVETVLKSEPPWAPTGIAVRGKDVFVLEYTNIDKQDGWAPRVRKLGPDGKVTILATLVPNENKTTDNSAAFSGSKAGDEREVAGIKLCWCPPGKFTMGSPPGEIDRRPDEAQADVTLTRGFWMGNGNVFEWCRDWYREKLPGGVDPDLSALQGAANRDGTFSRVRRGGAWGDDGKFLRSALRLRYEPPRRADHIGFRVVAIRTS